MTDIARVLKSMANLYMTASIVKRIAGDMVRAAPLSTLGAVGVVGIAAGLAWGHRRRPLG